MFDFLDLMPDADALLTEARREGVTLFGAGKIAYFMQFNDWLELAFSDILQNLVGSLHCSA
ncbi:MAG: hypothetical protein WBJ41_13080 [Chromatiaceae bacterium]